MKATRAMSFRFGVCSLGAVCLVSGAALAGIDVQIDPDPVQTVVQNEISLTIVHRPAQSDVLLAAYNDNPFPGGNGLGYSYSSDGGANWNSGQLVFPINPYTGGFMQQAFDPAITSDTQGNAYIGHIAWDALGYSGMFVRKSGDGGATWGAEVAVAVDLPATGVPDPNFRLNDRCQMAADTFGASPYTDNVYVAWIKDRGNDPLSLPYSDIYVSASSNLGGTFTAAQRINDVGQGRDMGNMPVPAVASGGTVYVSWLDYNVRTGGQGTIYLDKSTDGGATWGADQFVALIDLPPLNVTGNDGAQDARAKGAPVLATSPTDPNKLYIVYAADPDIVDPNNEADIFLIRSADAGATWTSAVRVNDDATTNDQILPWVEVKPDGTIDIAWYDRRNDVAAPPNGDLLWDIYITRSIDDGNSFAPNVSLNDTSFLSPFRGISEPWLGEYLGLAVDANNAYVIWTTTATGDTNGDLLFDVIANADIPEPATLALIAVGAAALLRRRRR